MQYPGTPLKLGSTGDAVGLIQARLQVQRTQRFGPTTQKTVIAFQKAFGLSPDGVVGPLTWRALFPIEGGPVARVIPEAWLPPGRNVDRIVMHWTAGQYIPTAFDRSHYHVLIAGSGEAVRGPKGPGEYLPHTRNLNTGSFGLCICAMAGAVEGQKPYRVPVTKLQWDRACQAAGEILHAYGLPMNERTLLCHSEVQAVYGRIQRGKWDIDAAGQPGDDLYTMTPTELHRDMRLRAEEFRKKAA